ncbi:MAG: Coenzyme F420 hydrogenase/dehydrogenase, beta subunit C-terminal domain, partial [Paraprevotella sp.]|nr:Coenzyme F420 hydrogenase/dehydrogenase, beta subunit C-terminal domain [Paraprevotella sp.]
YVQSDLTGIFRQVKNDLCNGMIVLFSGTPCQTSGLASYIGRRLRDRLYLVDIVCHGVPGPYVLRDYLAYLEKRHGASICWVNFRDKQYFGWRAHKETFKFVDGGVEVMMSFTVLFYRNIMFRRSCGKCPFCNTTRPSDLTLADFWGEKSVPEMNSDDKGVSLVLVNTEKGRRLFEAVKHEMDVVLVRLEDCLQPNLQHPSAIDPERDEFETLYRRKGLAAAMKRYGRPRWRDRRRKLVCYVKNVVKRLIRKKNENRHTHIFFGT